MVTARAVGRLATLAELASPLLRDGGALVAWKGRRDADEEAELERAAERLAMRPASGGGGRRLRGIRSIATCIWSESRDHARATAAPAGDGEEAAVQGLMIFDRTERGSIHPPPESPLCRRTSG